VKNTWTMNVEFYTDVDERLAVPMLLPPVPELVDLESARMLIADDVADTGETLRLVKDFCAGKVGEVRCAVLYEKSRSTVSCEYVWKRTDLWIDFPWSAQGPVTANLDVARRDGDPDLVTDDDEPLRVEAEPNRLYDRVRPRIDARDRA